MISYYKSIIKRLGFSGRDMCSKIGGMTYDSYRSLTRSGSKTVPRWVRSFVIGYELGRTESDFEKKSRDSQASNK